MFHKKHNWFETLLNSKKGKDHLLKKRKGSKPILFQINSNLKTIKLSLAEALISLHNLE